MSFLWENKWETLIEREIDNLKNMKYECNKLSSDAKGEQNVHNWTSCKIFRCI